MKNLLQYISRNKILWLIFCLALFIRSYQLDILPHGFYVEEMTNTYVGRFILLHGKDLYGNFSPLIYFDKFGDFPPVIPLYFSGIGTFLFGVNEFGGRFPIALFGALTIFPTYYLSFYIFKNRPVALFSGLLIALIPWHVVLSRTTSEGILAYFFYILGIYLILRGLEEKNIKRIYIALALFLFTYFLYPSLRIIVPLTLLPLPLFIIRNKILMRKLIAVVIIFFLITFIISSTHWGKARFFQTSLFHSPDIIKSIDLRNQNLSNGEGPSEVFLARSFHNKITGYAREFLNQYLSYFSTKYLFFEGGGQYRYYNVPDQGLLFVSVLPLFLLAFVPSKKIEKNYLLYFVYLLTITPIPAALTVDFPPHVHRSMFMILPFIILISSGAYVLQEYKYKKYSLLGIFVFFILLESIYFWHQYSKHSDSNQSILRNDTDRELTLYIKENHAEYDSVVMPVFERLPLYYLFYTNNFDNSFAGRFRTELRTDKIDNIQFIEDWCPSKVTKNVESKKLLLIDSANCEGSGNFREIKHFIRKDQTVAYRIFTN